MKNTKKNIKNIGIVCASALLINNIFPFSIVNAAPCNKNLPSKSFKIDKYSQGKQDIYVSQGSTFGVKIPKVIILDTNKKNNGDNEENKSNYIIEIQDATTINKQTKNSRAIATPIVEEDKTSLIVNVPLPIISSTPTIAPTSIPTPTPTPTLTPTPSIVVENEVNLTTPTPVVPTPTTIPLNMDSTSTSTSNTILDLNKIKEEEKIKVIPSSVMKLSQEGKEDINVLVSQDKKEWKKGESEVVGTGEILTDEVSSGIWTGVVDFEIKLEDDNNFVYIEALDKEENTLKSRARIVQNQNDDMEKDNLISELVNMGKLNIGFNEKAPLLIDFELENIEDMQNLSSITFNVSSISTDANEVAIIHFNETTSEWEFLGLEKLNKDKITINIKEDTFQPFVVVNEDGSFTLKEIDYCTVPFEKLSWKQIANLADSNEFFLYYKLGATKTFTYAGNTYTAEVIGVNTYNEGEITFLTKELVTTKYAMNEKDTNDGGWPNSNLRKIMNTTIYENLPKDLQLAITPKTLEYETSDGLEDNVVMVSSTDKLWLPTQYELIGVQIDKKMEENDLETISHTTISSKQKVYEAFLQIESTQEEMFIKEANGEINSWWIASPNLNNNSYFKTVFSSGLAESISAISNVENYFPIGFVI